MLLEEEEEEKSYVYMLIEIWVLIGFILAFIAGFVAKGFFDSAIKLEAQRLLNIKNSKKGVEVKAEKEERMSMAIAEAAALLKAGQQPPDVMKALLPKYPDVAMQLVKKLGKTGLGLDLEGLSE